MEYFNQDDIWFQHGGTTPHFRNATIQLLIEKWNGRVISTKD